MLEERNKKTARSSQIFICSSVQCLSQFYLSRLIDVSLTASIIIQITNQCPDTLRAIFVIVYYILKQIKGYVFLKKAATTLVDLLCIELMFRLSYVKQMYCQPMLLTHELILCIKISKSIVDISGDSAVKTPCQHKVSNREVFVCSNSLIIPSFVGMLKCNQKCQIFLPSQTTRKSTSSA